MDWRLLFLRVWKICTVLALCNAVVQSHPQGLQQPAATINLRQFGVTVPAKNTAPSHEIQIAFLSTDRLVMLDNVQDINYFHTVSLFLFDTARGTVLQVTSGDFGMLPYMQRISDTEFAVTNSKGILRCNLMLSCKRFTSITGHFQFSPNGQHVVIEPRSPYDKGGWLALDNEATNIASYTESFSSQMLAGDTGTFFSNNSQLLFYPSDHRSKVILRPEGIFRIGLVDGDNVLYLSGKKYQPVIISSSGIEQFKLDLHDLPGLNNHADIVSSLRGHRFGIFWQVNSTTQFFNPLACLDECPPSAMQRLVIYSSTDGSLLQAFQWDPRPWNLDVRPALSPDGKLAAFVQGSSLNIYEIR